MINEAFDRWFDLAGRLSAAEALAIRSGAGKEILTSFAKQSSVSPNMLRKMQRARAYIESHEPELLQSLSQVPLSYVDVLSRIGAINLGMAKETAARLVRDPSAFTYRKLLNIYDDIRADRSKNSNSNQRHKSHVAQYKKDILSAAKSGCINFIYPDVGARREILTFRPWKGGHEFVSPFMTSRTRKIDSSPNSFVTTNEIDAFDCYLQYDDDPRELARDRVMRGSTEATFFRRLWLVLPADQERLYEQMVYNLGPSNLGVLRFCAKSSVFECTLRPDNKPNPDRREFWTEHSISYCAK